MRSRILLIAIMVVIVSAIAVPASALFDWWQPIPGNTVATGTWGPLVGIAPGGSKAVRSIGPGPADVFPIASLQDTGEVVLDFGEVRPGNANASPDVLRISAYARDVRVALWFEGAIADTIDSVRLFPGEGDVIREGVDRRVYIKLDVPHDAQPGDIEGMLVISVDDGAETYRLPARLTVRGSGAERTTDARERTSVESSGTAGPGY